VAGRLTFQWNESTLDAMCAGWSHFYAMAAARGHQEVIDDNEGSFFTQALCDAFEGLGVGPNREGLMTVGRAFDNAYEELKRQAKEYARKYRVHFDQDAVSAGDGSQLPLARPKRPPPPPSPRDRNRAVMLEKVRKIWSEGIFKRNLFQQVRIHLHLSERPGAIFHRIGLFVQTPGQKERPLPKDETIVDVFDGSDPARMSQSLLIQGKPGSGKTFQLLELLDELLDRAGRDPSHPIPVVFPLSSWADRHSRLRERLAETVQRDEELARKRAADFRDWLAQELNRNYGVSRKLAQAWLEENKVLPLLDGLDEVKAEGRGACVEAISAFLRERDLLPLVVCSRTDDYDALRTTLEGFRGSVVVQPLTRPQVFWYLDELKSAGATIRQALRDDRALWELLDTPLMLYVLAMTCGGHSGRPVPTGGALEERRDRLFANYVDAMLHRRALEPRYPAEKTKAMIKRRANESDYVRYPQDQTKHWLSWLAWRMKKHNQTLFYIERLQPDWLAQGQRSLYTLVVGLVVGLVFGLAVGLVFGLVIGLAVGLATGHEEGKIECAESVRWSWSVTGYSLSNVFVPWLRFTLFAALVFVLVGALSGQLVTTLVTVLNCVLLFWLVLGLEVGLSISEIEMKTQPNQGIRRSARNSLVLGLLVFAPLGGLVGLGVGLVVGPENGLVAGPLVGLFGGCFACLKAGGEACMKHLTLRLVLARSGLAPWGYARFLDYAAEKILLNKQGGGYSFIHRMLLEHFARRFDASEYSDSAAEAQPSPVEIEV